MVFFQDFVHEAELHQRQRIWDLWSSDDVWLELVEWYWLVAVAAVIDRLQPHNIAWKDLILSLHALHNSLREITIRIKDEDYMSFQSAADNSGLRVDEKISEIIQYYVIIERNRKKFSQSTLFDVIKTAPECWHRYRLLQSSLHESRSTSWYPCKTALSSFRDCDNASWFWNTLPHCSIWHCKSRS